MIMKQSSKRRHGEGREFLDDRKEQEEGLHTYEWWCITWML